MYRISHGVFHDMWNKPTRRNSNWNPLITTAHTSRSRLLRTLSRPNSTISAYFPGKPAVFYDRYKNRGASKRPTYAVHWFPARFKIIRSLPAKRQGRPLQTKAPIPTLNRIIRALHCTDIMKPTT